jgi:hypothetical protein
MVRLLYMITHSPPFREERNEGGKEIYPKRRNFQDSNAGDGFNGGGYLRRWQEERG